MADRFKPLNTPMQCSDEYLDDVEVQACQLFEEFLGLPEPVCSDGFPPREVADAPHYMTQGHESVNLNRTREQPESFEDDDELVTDSSAEIVVKSGKGAEQKSPIPPQAGSQDQTLKDLAIKIRTAGDKLVQEHGYGDRASGIESSLLNVIQSHAADLTYDTFSNEVDRLIGRDRSWTNLVLAFYVGKRVVTKVGSVKRLFDQYVSKSYTPVFRQAGGVEPFVNSNMY